jgi:protein O-GlcNAc transferase
MNTAFGSFHQNFQQAVRLHDSGRLAEAERFYQTALTADNRHFECLHRLGILHFQQGRLADAEQTLRRAAKVDKRSAEVHQLLGSALSGLDRHEEAVRSYEKAIGLRRIFPEAYNNLGHALQALGRIEEAAGRYEKAISLRPDYPEARNNLGNALNLLGEHENAIAQYRKALELRPDYAEASCNLGTALRAAERFDEAIDCFAKAAAARPNYYDAFVGLGNVLSELGRGEEALSQYRKAIAIRPDLPQAHINLGNALVALDRGDDAIIAYSALLAARPDNAEALVARANVLTKQHREGEALADFEAARSADPDDDLAFEGLARLALITCDWVKAAPLWREVPAHVSQGRYFDPFSFLGFSDDAALQLACAKQYVRHRVPAAPAGKSGTKAIWRNQRIKIAYVAGSYHRHPTAYQTAELLEIHDRSRFEIIGISFGPDDESEIRGRIVRAFDQFHDVRYRTDRDVVRLLSDLQVDIAVDRGGFTINCRPGIFAARPAPVQVNYLGYPGTLGASFYDYVLADATVLPFAQQPYYTERIVHLPNCYQVSDTKKPVAAETPTRSEAGLPDQGFVFCCFNNNYKITPPVFDVWMRLLNQIEGSVLWLLSDREIAEGNLRREAQARGVDPGRLIFAQRVSLDAHLARHRLADLFLDTLPYNAHSTATDALWMGVPVVTCLGRSFAGRAAASQLRAIGTPDLVTDSLEAYEKLALHLASDPQARAEFRAKIERNRLRYPLFDTDRYRRNLETAYISMWDRWQRGEQPVSFAVVSEV